MTDAAVNLTGVTPRLDLTSDAARRRIKQRYAREARFKAYGIIALALTTVFLVVLLADIVMKGLPAFMQHSLVLNVPVTAEAVDPTGSRDPATIRGGDFTGLVNRTLAAEFPNVTSRQERRALLALLSSGAADELREKVMANPALIGTTVPVRVLLSDDVDLYFKGVGSKIVSRETRGTITPSATSGEIRLTSTSNDFADELLVIKQEVKRRADVLDTEADRLALIARDMARAVGNAEVALEAARRNGETALIPRLETDLTTRRGELDAMQAKVDEARGTARTLHQRFDNPKRPETLDGAMPSLLVAINGGLVKITSLGDTGVTGRTLLPLKSDAEAKGGTWRIVSYTTPESNRRVGDQEIAWLEALRSAGKVERHFNMLFFTSGDSREAELAGIRGALTGTALTLLVTLVICLPLGVAAAIYLEEFAPKNRITDLIEVNINNLAAVPSIVFGLLGLAVFLNFFQLPRSAPLVGGLVLALLVLPTIIIASRAALKAVPPSIKEAALGVGASQQQAIFHHVLPLAMPGIMTGTIIGMAHALGETAPLLMIGMVAFIVDVPGTLTEAATVLPVQIYLWSDLPEIAFQAKTAAAIMVLLGFLFLMNGMAIYLRRKFERRW